MKAIKYITFVIIGFLLCSCEVDYLDNPNEPKVAATYGIMNRVQKRLMDDTRDEWFAGRQSLLWVQYWSQVNYTEEDRYQYRETVNKASWNDLYKNAQDLIDLIGYNVNPDTKVEQALLSHAPNVNQIAASRILLVYIYQLATELWGDVPYWSYAGTNPDFQANKLKSDDILYPKYATQEDIYMDMLNELNEAQESIITSANMIDGDNFYAGDATKWKKLANSLRLRIANRIKGVYAGAADIMADAVADGVFESNADNAGVKYENNAVNGSPMYRAFTVAARRDFAPASSFVDLLFGDRGTFGIEDPRLRVYVDENQYGQIVGQPLTSTNGQARTMREESKPGAAILDPQYTCIYMEYSEVCFLLSEMNSWDQTWYEKGIQASMKKWGIGQIEINDYIDAINAAPCTQEDVMTQKYIALYMQPMEAWSEYRRTGYPHTLIQATVPYNYTYLGSDGLPVTKTYTYTPAGGLLDLPTRNRYLLNEANINNENLTTAITSNGGDTQSTPLWWMP